MEKETKNLVKVLVIGLVFSMIFFVGLNMTGRAISEEEESFVNVTRALVINNTLEGTKDVLLSIYSSENILAIEEVFIGEDCSVLEYDIDEKVDILNFVLDSNLWIIGNRSDTLVFDLSYSIPIDCDVDNSSGVVYTLKGEDVIPDVVDDGSSTGGSPGGSSSSGPGGAGSYSVPKNLSSVPIVQARDDEDFNTLISSAANRLAGITDESHELEKGNFYPFLILIVVGIIIIILIVFFILFKKPKDFEKKKPKDFEKKNPKDKIEILVKYLKEFKGKYPRDKLKKKVLSAGYSEKDFDVAYEKN